METRVTTICRLIAVLSLLFGVVLLAPGQKRIRPIQSDETTQADWQRWLDGDVRWIISAQERTAFLNLAKNEDRDRFIEDFWSRHDKEEHYHRIAYTNLHFGISVDGRTQAIPGWLNRSWSHLHRVRAAGFD